MTAVTTKAQPPDGRAFARPPPARAPGPVAGGKSMGWRHIVGLLAIGVRRCFPVVFLASASHQPRPASLSSTTLIPRHATVRQTSAKLFQTTRPVPYLRWLRQHVG